MSYLKQKNSQFKPINIEKLPDEPYVQDGLAVTPAEMMEMVAKGIPVATGNLRELEDYKTSDSDFTVPMEMRRGVDVADMYQLNQEFKSRTKKAAKERIDYMTALSSAQSESSVASEGGDNATA